MRLTASTLGSLSCKVLQAEEATPPTLAVVLCHGYGAPGDDLVPLGAELLQRAPALASKVRFVFPAAPLAPPELMGGRAWWPIAIERYYELAARGEEGLKAIRADVPDGLAKARGLLLGAVDELSRGLKLPYSRIVLGGFSQGSMLATDLALRLEEAPAALAILSGTLLCEGEWTRRAPIRRGLPVFQSHGDRDPVLPFANAEALRDLLTTAGLSVEFLRFRGEHGIPLPALEGLARLLTSLAGT